MTSLAIGGLFLWESRPDAVAVDGRQAVSDDRPDHAAPLRTANFMTQDDIGGEDTEFINDIELRNAPNTTVSRRGIGAPTLVATGLTFNKVDQQPTIRQLYTIAELGKPAGEPTRAPEFMRLLVSADQPRIEGEGLDFRDEIMAQIFDQGDPAPKRRLTFHIELTDDGETTGTQLEERRTFRNWRRVGTLTFDNAVISLQRRLRDSFQSPDVAREPERSVDGDARRPAESPVARARCRVALRGDRCKE